MIASNPVCDSDDDIFDSMDDIECEGEDRNGYGRSTRGDGAKRINNPIV